MNDGTPEFFWRAEWSPICGHWFWDNQNGARSFCQKLGYINGTQSGRGLGHRYAKDAIRIGTCKTGEHLESCSEGCNDKGVGNGKCAKCAAGEAVKITVTCDGHTTNTVSASCAGNVNDKIVFINVST